MRSLCLIMGVVFAGSITRAQDDRIWSVSLFGAYTTSSKLFPHPNADNEFLRSEFDPINSVPGIGTELRFSFEPIGLHVGIGAEYIRKSVSESVPNTSSAIPMIDGYYAIPVDLTGYFFIPVGGEHFDFYMGGGGGVYFGERIYEYAGVRAGTISKDVNFGIHVVTGLEYVFTRSISLRSDVKFRSVILESVQRFDTPSTIYGGQIVPLPQEPLPSRIQIDGMHVSLGIVFRPG